MLYVTQSDLWDEAAGRGLSDDDCLELDKIYRAESIDYRSLFFLYECQAPHGKDDYNGACFSD